MTTFSVIIPALDEADQIGRAVSSAWGAGAAEVIVVDGGSTDDTMGIAIAAGAEVLEAACGRASQQNAGAKQATSEFLLFLHADTWLSDATGPQLTEVLNDPGVRHGAFRQQIDAGGLLFRWLEKGNAVRARWRGMAYGDQGIFLRRSLFEQLGGFPEVPLMEDVLLMRQLKKQGTLRLLPGPLHVSARRWQKNGVLRQTARNWFLLMAERCCVSLDQLAEWYRPREH